MRYISAAGKSFQQGSDEPDASAEEKPAMTVRFAYDFWIDTVEVNQSEFFSLAGYQPVPPISPFGTGDVFPVYNVSWFDAALYCNARSLAAGLDTVYSYVEVKKTTSGSVYDLIGMRINYERYGFRLPTEAEWEYAAKAGIGPSPRNLSDSALSECGWFSGNSGGTSHPVASRMSSGIGLYDMFGNVFEWTNDWKGPYRAQTVIDPLGMRSPDVQFERVIKGGSFQHGFSFGRPSCRASSYPTTPSSTAEYVGFRCVVGAIRNGTFRSLDTNSFATSPVDLLVSETGDLLGTRGARLAFVNVTGSMRTLCLVDFASVRPIIRECFWRSDVFCPTISPDGRYVAFCTRGEGAHGPATIFIQSFDSTDVKPLRLESDSAFMPRWWVDHSAADTFVIYTTSAVNNKDPRWSSSRTMAQQMSGGVPAGEPRAIISDGGFHDGLSWSGTYAATGYTMLLMKNRQTGEQKHLFLYPQHGKPQDGSTQVCNVSMCPDKATEDRVLFLDFGSPKGSSLVGRPYRMHEYLFITRFSGDVISWFACPAGESSWEDCEWSNRRRFVIGCGMRSSGSRESIYLLDVFDGRTKRLAGGTFLATPALWVDTASAGGSGIDSDSLGKYNDPPLNSSQSILAYKMNNFWKQHDSLQGVFIGNSQIADGIDPREIVSCRTYNLAYGGADILSARSLLFEYIMPHCPELKFVGMGLGTAWLNDYKGNRSWLNGFAQSKGYVFDRQHNFWKLGLPQDFVTTVLKSNSLVALGAIDSCGLVVFPSVNWGGTSPAYTHTTWNTSSPNFAGNFEMIKEMANRCMASGAKLLIIEPPQSPHFAGSGVLGPDGPSTATAASIHSMVLALARDNPWVSFYDANLYGKHDYTDAEAYDAAHLSEAGARKLSRRIDSLVAEWLVPQSE